MPSGPREDNVTQMLHSHRLASLIESVREDFDFILIDSPPALPLTDARLLAQHADGVIVIVRAGATTAEQTMTVKRRFMQDGTYLFGTILNNWNASAEDPAFMSSYLNYGAAYGNSRRSSASLAAKKRSAAAGG
jgi:Mrp family chromosome partitioning ATPase